MKTINQNAPVRSSKAILIEAGPQKVWGVLTRINQWPHWQKGISKATLHGPLAVGTSFDWKSQGLKIHSTLHTVEPCKRFGWTGRSLGVYAIHNWELEQKNEKTRVVVAESMEGFLASLFRKSFTLKLEKGMQSWLELLKEECEP